MGDSRSKMAKVRVAVDVTAPTPEHRRHRSVEERVRDAVELIDTGYNSEVEWDMIRRLWNYLCACKQHTERQRRILEMIKPVMEKYGKLDHRGVEAWHGK